MLPQFLGGLVLFNLPALFLPDVPQMQEADTVLFILLCFSLLSGIVDAAKSIQQPDEIGTSSVRVSVTALTATLHM